jgi:hypothetical protein
MSAIHVQNAAVVAIALDMLTQVFATDKALRTAVVFTRVLNPSLEGCCVLGRHCCFEVAALKLAINTERLYLPRNFICAFDQQPITALRLWHAYGRFQIGHAACELWYYLSTVAT